MNDKKKKLKRKADLLWYHKCLEIYGNICEVCGKQAIQCHHFVPKGLSLGLRYDLKNGVPLCMGCHFKHHHQGDPAIHEAIRKKRGKRWWNYLKNRREKHQTLTIKWLEDIIAKLEK